MKYRRGRSAKPNPFDAVSPKAKKKRPREESGNSVDVDADEDDVVVVVPSSSYANMSRPKTSRGRRKRSSSNGGRGLPVPSFCREYNYDDDDDDNSVDGADMKGSLTNNVDVDDIDEMYQKMSMAPTKTVRRDPRNGRKKTFGKRQRPVLKRAPSPGLPNTGADCSSSTATGGFSFPPPGGGQLSQVKKIPLMKARKEEGTELATSAVPAPPKRKDRNLNGFLPYGRIPRKKKEPNIKSDLTAGIAASREMYENEEAQRLQKQWQEQRKRRQQPHQEHIDLCWETNANGNLCAGSEEDTDSDPLIPIEKQRRRRSHQQQRKKNNPGQPPDQLSSDNSVSDDCFEENIRTPPRKTRTKANPTSDTKSDESNNWSSPSDHSAVSFRQQVNQERQQQQRNECHDDYSIGKKRRRSHPGAPKVSEIVNIDDDVAAVPKPNRNSSSSSSSDSGAHAKWVAERLEKKGWDSDSDDNAASKLESQRALVKKRRLAVDAETNKWYDNNNDDNSSSLLEPTQHSTSSSSPLVSGLKSAAKNVVESLTKVTRVRLGLSKQSSTDYLKKPAAAATAESFSAISLSNNRRAGRTASARRGRGNAIPIGASLLNCDSNNAVSSSSAKATTNGGRDSDVTNGPQEQERQMGVSPSKFHEKRPRTRASISSTIDSFCSSISSPRRLRSSKRLRSKKTELIEIDSSDDDGALEAELDDLERKVSRIAIGKKVHSSDCSLRISKNVDDSNAVQLELHYANNKGTKTQEECATAHSIDLSEDLQEIKVYRALDPRETTGAEVEDTIESPPPSSLVDGSSDVDSGSNHQKSFVAMRIKKTKDNGLKRFSNVYRPDDDAAAKERQFILVEFWSNGDFDAMVETLRGRAPDLANGLLATADSNGKELLCQMDEQQAKTYAKPLLDHSRTENKRRLRSSRSMASREKNGFLEGREDGDILLVFPFEGDTEEMELASKGLGEWALPETASTSETSPMDIKTVAGDRGALANPSQRVEPSTRQANESNSNDEKEDTTLSSSEKGRARFHFITIRVSDYERLVDPEEYLNDTLIDFWMRWMSRHSDNSDTHYFGSHFYTTLSDESVGAVTKWTKNKGIDVFQKKFLFFTINKDLHWSYCVIVNPGCIMEHLENMEKNFDENCGFDPDSPMPCILYFDSLKFHPQRKIANKLLLWLNSEWKRLGRSPDQNTKLAGEPFTGKSMTLYTPKVPYQDNSWDCGVFVCRYSYAMHHLRHRTFSYNETNPRVLKKRNLTPFQDLVTKSEAFAFNTENIVRFRSELKTLIERLSKLYIPWRAEADLKEKEEKAAARKVHLTKQHEDQADPKPKDLLSASTQNSDVKAVGDTENANEEGTEKQTPLDSGAGNVTEKERSLMQDGNTKENKLEPNGNIANGPVVANIQNEKGGNEEAEGPTTRGTTFRSATI